MKLYYQVKPVLVRRINLIEHIGKKRDFIQSLHTHASYGHEIIYLDYGRLLLTLNGSKIELAPGQIIFIHGGVSHTFTGIEGVPFHYMNVMFRGSLPEDFFQKPMSVGRDCARLLESLRNEVVCRNAYLPEMAAAMLTELIIRLLRSFLVGRETGEENMPRPANRIHLESETVEKALSIIRGNFASELTLGRIGAAVGVSESHLRALLRRETGKSFMALLHEARIDNAKRLIMEDGCTLTEIAAKVGYSAPAFFFRMFKRSTGMTPKKYSESLGDFLADSN